MARPKSHFACQACGAQAPKWLGKCPDCGGWNTMAEEVAEDPSRRPTMGNAPGASSKPVALSDVPTDAEARRRTGIHELDRVLGGGVVAGSLVLLGGDPGIGKSTLLLSAMARLSASGPVLYVSGEESLRQTKLRADRLEISAPKLHLLAETDANVILATAEDMKPTALVVDSIQTLFLPELQSAPGSVTQVREVAGRLMLFAKRSGVPTFLVGHVTKDGAIAGPRVLEHLVDTVLYFEGERGHSFRILRAHKNRFGSTDEVGVFEMKGAGLEEVLDPSALFLAERPNGQSGSAVTAALSGSRPLLVEVQALVAPASYGTGRRTAIGVDGNRVALLAAVLEKKAGLAILGCDIFVNVAGGMQLTEPGVDLALCAALASSLRNKAIDPHTLVLGEVGLAGELRAVTQLESRLNEAHKRGFRRALVPQVSLPRLGKVGLTLVPAEDLSTALNELLG
ncbi:MAG: DNA repair protein RadA [Myxococcaceae bacterium]